MKIVTICGAGIGSSAILKVNAEKALAALGLTASVVAADVASVQKVSDDANVILTSQEFVEAIGSTYAEVIVIRNHFDQAEITAAVDRALGEH
ncbi:MULTISPECIES: PTS sugar transporter subunit IIB [unclassified Curtobacterium]|jgi:PTS system ascorbate-specific IIB component|uniref:PTS sugar transporter subunit IIB n=1 Tax=unclassified Curtobacterium TaxID=257496 RepID=UPI00089DFEF2|nr:MULTISPECIES: PTS sugar transporter subunit IIB [unclassified Curtobacterium]AOX66745.1 PTS ascorbate transporter subunit IIB [Curtobacterium sp. BH-2-1-1]MCC8908518.1 PTS sugar transporter subunit IIB [Curtobacterium sp. GD1]MCT9622227.1 PTS sugar transporter subunit IIB [Curtobacterium sp. C2H10]MDR6172194.1 PTS system ascorbate-specific IIB component [Curtobacterium sp. SORGH_AS_0776]MDR6571941.1 PTS system ascorbate-specific IIB component [Curtobacterium sp. 320]